MTSESRPDRVATIASICPGRRELMPNCLRRIEYSIPLSSISTIVFDMRISDAKIDLMTVWTVWDSKLNSANLNSAIHAIKLCYHTNDALQDPSGCHKPLQSSETFQFVISCHPRQPDPDDTSERPRERPLGSPRCSQRAARPRSYSSPRRRQELPYCCCLYGHFWIQSIGHAPAACHASDNPDVMGHVSHMPVPNLLPTYDPSAPSLACHVSSVL